MAAMAEGPTTLGSETKALEVLKVLVNDPACSTLDLAHALQSHLNAYPQSQKELSEKLGVPQKRAYLSQVLALLKEPWEQT
ncbi:MAG: hypothetical protein A2992_04140 [Elusimicrobia bacterium RIFCSPLOWO2_01_FULL_59_12]|nr:MAG: hypothetical protein A2992_04140 [Elusimicrobia bacterium RIFCSPLOWO2_01_FULL_59_12]